MGKTCKQCLHYNECKDDAYVYGVEFNPVLSVKYCTEFKAITNADRMIEMLKENDVYSLLDCWQEIFEDGVPSEDYFKWWLQQPAEVD